MKKGIWIVIAVIIIALVVWLIVTPKRVAPSKYDAFATCIKDSGTTFYGAFWCPHCRDQKALFGTAVRFLPYVECSNPDGHSQNALCNAAKIDGYPTWDFSKAFDLTSSSLPHKCTADASEPVACQRAYNPNKDSWLIGSIIVYTPVTPIKNGTKWTVAAGARMGGLTSLEVLSEATSCELPK